MKPDFIVIGAMKCGTSTVSAYLEDHPDVFMLPGSEPNFFSHDDRFALGSDWYEGLFAGHGGERLIGEGSNDYASGLVYPEAAARMAAYRPDLKLIYMVRHPVERITSAWVQNRADSGDRVPPTLDRAVREQPERFVGQSLYWHNLSLYRAVFPDAQIFVGFMEDLSADRAAFFEALCGFLGLVPAATIRRGHVNPSQGKSIPGPLYSVLNGLPFMPRVKKLWPKSMRSYVKRRLLSRTITTRPDFSPAAHSDLLARLRDDSAALLQHCGKPADFWRLEA